MMEAARFSETSLPHPPDYKLSHLTQQAGIFMVNVIYIMKIKPAWSNKWCSSNTQPTQTSMGPESAATTPPPLFGGQLYMILHFQTYFPCNYHPKASCATQPPVQKVVQCCAWREQKGDHFVKPHTTGVLFKQWPQKADFHNSLITILLAWDMALALLIFPQSEVAVCLYQPPLHFVTLLSPTLMTDAACASETPSIWLTHIHTQRKLPLDQHQYWTNSDRPKSISSHRKLQWNISFFKKLHIWLGITFNMVLVWAAKQCHHSLNPKHI